MTAAEVVALPPAPACAAWCAYPDEHVGPNGWDEHRPHANGSEATKICQANLGTAGGSVDGIALRLSRVATFDSAYSADADVDPATVKFELHTDSLTAVGARALAALLQEGAAIIG